MWATQTSFGRRSTGASARTRLRSGARTASSPRDVVWGPAAEAHAAVQAWTIEKRARRSGTPVLGVLSDYAAQDA